MTIQNVLSLLGGLALFLYGMHMMSVGLETAAGDRMKAILEKDVYKRQILIMVLLIPYGFDSVFISPVTSFSIRIRTLIFGPLSYKKKI